MADIMSKILMYTNCGLPKTFPYFFYVLLLDNCSIQLRIILKEIFIDLNRGKNKLVYIFISGFELINLLISIYTIV